MGVPFTPSDVVSAVVSSSHGLFATRDFGIQGTENVHGDTLGALANPPTFHSRTLFVGKHGLEQAKQAIVAYKTGQTKEMTPELWHAKKIVDSTLHPGM